MIILNADDFGLSDGVSRGIVGLCTEGRVSATSAFVTFDRWHRDAVNLRSLRPTTAIGLHLNLTLGRPLVARDRAVHLGADGSFLPVGRLMGRTSIRRLTQGWTMPGVELEGVRAECRAQIMAFRDAMGVLPDFIDGHHHVHVMPAIREALLEAIADFAWAGPPLIRVPSDQGGWLGGRRSEGVKRAFIWEHCRGMREKLAEAGLPTNDTFAGFSSFAVGSDYGEELSAALEGGGTCHLVMSHPGHVEAELKATGDPLIERRAEELAGIMAFEGLAERIWHPVREADGAIDWVKAMAA